MERYWFKRKRYGYGWTPSSKEGWLLMTLYLVLALTPLFLFENEAIEENPLYMMYYFLYFAFLTLSVLIISFAKGPKPKWRWGVKEDDKPDEDF